MCKVENNRQSGYCTSSDLSKEGPLGKEEGGGQWKGNRIIHKAQLSSQLGCQHGKSFSFLELTIITYKMSETKTNKRKKPDKW